MPDDLKQYANTLAKQEVVKALKGAIGKAYSPTYEELEEPPNKEFGDVAFPCFNLAKGMSRNPAEIATELAAKIGAKEIIEKVEAKGPYVNFTYDMKILANQVIKEIKVLGNDYGKHVNAKGRKIMVEYANFNTHKEIHIGHIRNMVEGMMAINLLRATGAKVIAASYINDLGNNVAKCLWAIKKFHEHEVPEKGDEINFLGRVYTEATRESEDNEEAKQEISEVQRALETKKGDWNKLWKQTRQWSIDAIYKIYKEMGLPIDAQYYESDLLESTKEIVDNLLEEGIAKESKGAIIVDLNDKDLRVSLLRKTDGTYLYNAKDLALAKKKSRDYELDRSIIVVDVRQSLALNQLFATLKLMGLNIPYEHLSYAFVTIPGGTMSSRKGNIVTFDEIKSDLEEAAESETRKRHEDWSEKKVKETAKIIAHSAMVYTMAKQDSQKDIVFKLEDALSFEGTSGPYILYSITRMKSVLAKANIKPSQIAPEINSKEARELVRLIAKYPEILAKSARDLHIEDVPQYAFELSQAFSSYYAQERIIDQDSKEETAARLALVEAVLITLENTCEIMNIKTLTEM